MFSFLKSPVNVIHVNDMDSLIGKVEILDIREPFEYRGGSLKTAKNVPMGNLLADPDQYLKKDQTYYIMCQSGGRSGNATRALAKKGFDVVNVAGGMGSYVGSKRK